MVIKRPKFLIKIVGLFSNRATGYLKTIRLERSLVKGVIYFYRYFFKPFLPMSCRFYPSCSSYALEAIDTFGFLKGTFKILWRLLRCHPWCEGGYDPVLPNNEINK